MGHERIGFLPRTKKWRDVVDDIARYSRGSIDATSLGNAVLNNVRHRFNFIAEDTGVHTAFYSLVVLAYAGKGDVTAGQLTKNALPLAKNPTEFQIVRGVANWIDKNVDSKEYAELAKSAVIDAIILWQRSHSTGQVDAFSGSETVSDVWRKASNGAGFTELSRLFFSKFTERYIAYFLEREAGAQVTNWGDVVNLRSDLADRIDSISRYAFETSKITESFAAGWYNKNTKKRLPNQKQIKGFLSYAFEKISEELRRERLQ